MILSCPFCGYEAELRESDTCHDTWLVRCTNCQIKTVTSYTKNEAIETWNARVVPEQITAWKCMGRKQSLPELGECNWPDCGCDPYATKIIESLLEQGWFSPLRREHEKELFNAATKIDLGAAVRHLRNWESYINNHDRQTYADLLTAQGKLIAWLLQSSAASP